MRWVGLTADAIPRFSERPRPFPSPKATPSISRSVTSMPRPIQNPRPKIDLETEAMVALQEARAKAPGPERIEAMKRAGILQNAVDMQGLLFAKRGRPSKT